MPLPSAVQWWTMKGQGQWMIFPSSGQQSGLSFGAYYCWLGGRNDIEHTNSLCQ